MVSRNSLTYIHPYSANIFNVCKSNEWLGSQNFHTLNTELYNYNHVTAIVHPYCSDWRHKSNQTICDRLRSTWLNTKGLSNLELVGSDSGYVKIGIILSPIGFRLIFLIFYILQGWKRIDYAMRRMENQCIYSQTGQVNDLKTCSPRPEYYWTHLYFYTIILFSRNCSSYFIRRNSRNLFEDDEDSH